MQPTGVMVSVLIGTQIHFLSILETEV